MKLMHYSQLDWNRARDAAGRVVAMCNDAPYIAPEDLVAYRVLLVEIAKQMDTIARSLLLTPGADRDQVLS